MAIIDPQRDKAAQQAQFERDMMAQMGAIGIGQTVTTTGLGSIFPQVYRTAYEFETTPHTMLYHASVEKAENGFILKVTHKQGEQPKVYVAADTEELQRVFIAAIVGERIGK